MHSYRITPPKITMQYKREFLVPSQLHPIPQVLYQSFWSWWFWRKSRRTYSHFSVQPARKPPPLGLIMPFASYHLLIPSILPKILRAPQIKWQHLDETLCPSIRSEKRLGRFDKIDQFYASVCLIWQRCSSFSQKASEDDNYYDKTSLLLASDPQEWLKAYWCCRLRQQSTNPSSHCVWVSFAWTTAPPFCTICASCSLLCEHKSINKQR